MDSESFENGGFLHRIPRLFVSGITWALFLLFALVGCITGAFAGALAGKASGSGVIRGVGLGAIAGTILSLEIFEASRAFLSLDDNPTSPGSSPLVNFTEQVLRGSFVDGHFSTDVLTYNNHWQINFGDISYDNINDAYVRVASRGLSSDVLKKLPFHEISNEIDSSQNVCCSICLQDLEVGDIARSLPECSHTFHLKCVDQWLVRHGSCPVCRHNVKLNHIKALES